MTPRRALPPSRFHLGTPAAQPRGLFAAADFARLREFVEVNPTLGPTPLRKDKPLARELGLKQLLLKDETDRFALPAFKGLGAGFAIAALRARGALGAGATVVCASEGNHGRAVARAAREHGLRTRVYLGERVAQSRMEAIALEGAEVQRVAGSYDDAVRHAAAEASANGWTVISDTAYPGYEEIPRLIMLGYTRLMDEAAAQWKEKPPQLVLVQGGVGGLAAAVASWYAANPEISRARLVCVEPLAAACLLESAVAGRAVSVPGPHQTIMGGLRCGETSTAALPAVLEGFDAFLAIDDGWTRQAMLRLARPSPEKRAIAAGASGAAGLAALLALRDEPALAPLCDALAMGAKTRAMVIVTEGVTEPELYEEVVGGGAGTRQR
jgi:diaminopropionate ammonia-lyase